MALGGDEGVENAHDERGLGAGPLGSRRARVSALAATALVVAVAVLSDAPRAGDPSALVDRVAAAEVLAEVATPTPAPTPTPTPVPTPTPLVPVDDGLTADQRQLELVGNLGDDAIRPKSVVDNGNGLFFAQNIMYRHSITVYDRDLQLLATIDDTVDLAAFGHPDHEGGHQGAPVEAAFDSTGSYAYVSNYRMYGPGFDNAGGDACLAGDWDHSYVYRVDTETLAIDAVIEVGAVPKFVAVTPDDAYLLVSNWCSYDLSVIDTATNEEVARIDIGQWPRGIAVTADSRTAYVSEMGTKNVHVVDLVTLEVVDALTVGQAPRHLLLSPDEDLLYVTLNLEGSIAKVDLATGEILGEVVTGSLPRSMTISEDGTALYVVNNGDATMAKVATETMEVIDRVSTGLEPIGITYDEGTRNVWVSVYTGQLMVFGDRAPAE